MTESAKDQDQSMEEILQSIKRIIAEEGEPVPQGSDVLELTDFIPDEPEPVPEARVADLTIDEIMAGASGDIPDHMLQKESAPEPVVEPEPVFEPIPEPEAEPEHVAIEPEPVFEPLPVEAPAPIAEPDDALISDVTRDAAAAAFDVLKHLPSDTVVPRSHSLATRSGTTVEDLLLESLRPMLREWLDTNLPDLVERLVDREVRKITAR